MDLTADIKLMYAAWPAVDVVWTPKTGTGGGGRAILDEPGTVMLGGEVLGTDYSLRYPASTFPAVRQGDGFTVGTMAFKARENAQPASLDGLESIVPLIKVGS